MRIVVSVLLYMLFPLLSHTQPPAAVKYKDEVFAGFSLQKDLSYGMASHEGIKKKHFLFDLYEPASDTSRLRPLIIWLHGGGFKFGSKKARGIQLWSEMFAKRGYVAAGLNYPLSKRNTLFKFEELRKACSDAVEAVEEAIAFFKKNASQYRIDTNRIIVAGNSAGGMIALQAAYTSPAELAAYAQLPVSPTRSTKTNPESIAAVVNFWGGIFNLNWLNNSRVPIFSAHGSTDKIVSPDHRPGDTAMYGSEAIHRVATQKNIPNAYQPYPGYSHELQKHFNPIFGVSAKTRDRWRDAAQLAANFLYTELFKDHKWL